MYQCSHCGASQPAPMGKCPNCGVPLMGVKCNACGYVGPEAEFIKNDHRCPKCNTLASLFRERPGRGKCRRCGKRFGSDDRYCSACGTLRWIKLWPGVLGSGAVAALYAVIFAIMIADPEASDPGFRIAVGCMGAAVLAWLVFAILKVFRTLFSRERLRLKRGAK